MTINHANGIILRGNQIVMPKTLWKRSVKLAHVGHQGLAETKALIREQVWFPFIEKIVKEEISSCLPCQAVGAQIAPEPCE